MVDSNATGTFQRSARCVLLDIEGTVADVRFVYDVMFPFVRRQVTGFLEERWDEDSVQSALCNVASESGVALTADPWREQELGRARAIANAVDAVHQLMDQDSKTTGLKALQGRIWESGFRSGALRSELFPDVVPALQKWKSAGVELRIYSSGSILAQRLFFGHSTHGDLTPLLAAHYDTTIGSKKEAASYRRIAGDCKCEPHEILFLSDVAGELEAAAEAGMQFIACVRPNNVALPESYRGPTLASFETLEISYLANSH